MKKSIIIQGPQGCGKRQLAKTIAGMIGRPYSIITMAELCGSAFALSRILIEEPKAVIIEGFNGTNAEMSFVKQLVSNDKLEIPVKGGMPYTITTPNFIFCTGNADLLNINGDDRRFILVQPVMPVAQELPDNG